jgi:AcrR family transcriptional regulator
MAERLFAQKGLAEASVREIAAKARVNLAAINYHFGSKEGLARAVLTRRIEPLNAERLRLLDKAKACRGALRLEDVLYAFVAPTIRLFRRNPWFMKILGRLSSEASSALRKDFLAQFEHLVQRFAAALACALPGAPAEENFWRMSFLYGAMVQIWCGAEDLENISRGVCRLSDDALLVRRLVDFGAAGLRAGRSFQVGRARLLHAREAPSRAAQSRGARRRSAIARKPGG